MTSLSNQGTPRISGHRAIGLFGWTAIGLVMYLLADHPITYRTAAIGVHALSIMFGVWVFLTHGKTRITAASLFAIGNAVFVGYAGLWWNTYLDGRLPPYMIEASLGGYLCTVLMYYVFWHQSVNEINPNELGKPSLLTLHHDARPMAWGRTAGLTLALASLGAHQLLPAARPLLVDSAFVGTCLFATAAALSGRSIRLVSSGTATSALLILLFVLVTFQGFGRLEVIALGSAVAMALSVPRGVKWVKYTALIAAPLLGLILTSLRRDEYQVGLTQGGADSDVSGLFTFARLLNLEGLNPTWGSTFWATLTLPIPRSLWPDKPKGFGAELTAFLEPHLASGGHSMVSTVYGEWYYNFGWVGLVLLVLMVGPPIRRLDMHITAIRSRPGYVSRARLVWFVVLIVSSATIIDFVWSGTHTWAARMVMRLLVLAGFLILGLILDKMGQRRQWTPFGSRQAHSGSSHLLP